LVASSACAGGVERYDRDQIEHSLESGDAGLVIGVFPLKKGGVVDGDTIKVGGLDNTLRLLGMDTEETFKSEGDKRLYETGWENYLEKKQAETKKPIKVATPLGEDAKHFAQDFFRGVQQVRLERDHPKEIRGRFNRYLAYVFAERDGEWINYNIEAVRAGMSPYFPKYGKSRRFHDEFVAAQDEARAAERGIWDPAKEHYRDYDVRLAWWGARGEFVERFEEDGEGRDDFIALTNWDAPRRLQDKVGEEVVLLATVGDVYAGDKVTKVMLGRRMGDDFPLVFFDRRVLEKSGIEGYVGEYVRVSGIVATYKSKRRNAREQLQIIVNVPSQITLPGYEPPIGSIAPEADQPPSEPEIEPTPTAPEEPAPTPEIEPQPEPAPEPAPEPDALEGSPEP
jgi:endonuclease YncB( thermonuclease family)